jgi:hypothetical protein
LLKSGEKTIVDGQTTRFFNPFFQHLFHQEMSRFSPRLGNISAAHASLHNPRASLQVSSAVAAIYPIYPCWGYNL